MGIDRETLEQIGKHLLRRLELRIANMIARGVVQLTDDGKKLQLLQLGVLAGETIDAAEFHQAYGFSSVPLGGAEAVVVFPGSDRAHPIVVSVSDRRYRPTGGEPGEVTIYNDQGAKVKLLTNGDIEVQPGSGGKVYIRDEGGTTDALVKKSEFNAHTHTCAGSGSPSSTPIVPATGTTKVEAE